jgi:hypothetical protein
LVSCEDELNACKKLYNNTGQQATFLTNRDTFRIRIWWKDAAGEHDVYDNSVDQPIGGGNIVVHTR